MDPPSEEFLRLERLAPYTAIVSIDTPPEPLSVGSQFLLILLPFGSIEVSQPRELLSQFLRERSALVGIKVLEMPPNTISGQTSIALKTVSLSAYDLLLTRHLVAKVELEVKGQDVTPLILRGESSEFRQFGFEPQLKPLLVEAFREACDHVVQFLKVRRNSTN